MHKKEAAARQIAAAIKHYEDGEYECAITLAGAAEGQVTAEEGSKHLFQQLKVRVPPEFKNQGEWTDWLNATRDWLKHPTPHWGEEWEITERAAGLMIERAITKFHWASKQSTERMEKFLSMSREKRQSTE